MMKGLIGGITLLLGIIAVAVGALALTGPAKIAIILFGVLLALGGIIYWVTPSTGVDSSGKAETVKLNQEGTGRTSQVVVNSSGQATIPNVIYTVNPDYSWVLPGDRFRLDELVDRTQSEMEKQHPTGFNDCGATRAAFDKALPKVKEQMHSERPGLRGLTDILEKKVKLSCSLRPK